MRDDRIPFSRKQSVEAGVSPALQQKEVAHTVDPQRYSDFVTNILTHMPNEQTAERSYSRVLAI